MSDYRRIVTYYFDVEEGVPVSSVSELTPTPTWRTYYPGTQVLFRAHLLNHDGSYFLPPADATWLFGFDNQSGSTVPDLVVSLNDQFNNAEDWTGDNGVAQTAGRICWRADLTSALLKTYMATQTASVALKACLWMNSPGIGYDLKCQWNIFVEPVYVDPTIAKTQPGIQHVTLDLMNASCIPLRGDGYRFRARNKELSLYFPDGKWATLVPKIVDGKRTLDFIDDPED